MTNVSLKIRLYLWSVIGWCSKRVRLLLRLPYLDDDRRFISFNRFCHHQSMIASEQIMLIFFSMAFITSADFIVNDYLGYVSA
ncbi:MAG: hypothetical protein ACFCUE_08580 [Candidatus Bathyarchaeia archaeon]|jgi:hypothetical protein